MIELSSLAAATAAVEQGSRGRGWGVSMGNTPMITVPKLVKANAKPKAHRCRRGSATVISKLTINHSHVNLAHYKSSDSRKYQTSPLVMHEIK